MPELLKNNYLVGPALEAVKRLDAIDEIWDNLKKEFRLTRVLLRQIFDQESIVKFCHLLILIVFVSINSVQGMPHCTGALHPE